MTTSGVGPDDRLPLTSTLTSSEGEDDDAQKEPRHYRYYALQGPGGSPITNIKPLVTQALEQVASSSQATPLARSEARARLMDMAARDAYYGKRYANESGPWDPSVYGKDIEEGKKIAYDKATESAIVATYEAWERAPGLDATFEFGTITFRDRYGKYWHTDAKKGIGREGNRNYVELGYDDIQRPGVAIVNTSHLHTLASVGDVTAGGDNRTRWNAYVIRSSDKTVWYIPAQSQDKMLLGRLLKKDGRWIVDTKRRHYSDAGNLPDPYAPGAAGSEDNCHWYNPFNVCHWYEYLYYFAVPVVVGGGIILGGGEKGGTDGGGGGTGGGGQSDPSDDPLRLVKKMPR